ncbi:hypothetical protein GQ53DRAFT_687197 [Thozetella sp. PMI_491]|nr:hypothetical protein GQ53DRAFT_687197 [Thozetella sp. PMI_491]
MVGFMPRKFKTSASVAQNRENQRRSRARQRDLIDGMRKMLQEYERRDAMASVEMQHAARAAMRENQSLRIMLSQRGVQHEEIQAFLRGLNGNLDSTPRPTCHDPHPPLRLPASEDTEKLAADVHLEQRNKERQTISFLGHTGSVGLEGDQTQHISRRMPTSQSPYPTVLEAPQFAQMPCVTAAGIIAGLDGEKDAAKALLALGCSGTNNCFVKHSKLFQLIDNALE